MKQNGEIDEFIDDRMASVMADNFPPTTKVPLASDLPWAATEQPAGGYFFHHGSLLQEEAPGRFLCVYAQVSQVRREASELVISWSPRATGRLQCSSGYPTIPRGAAPARSGG